MNENPKNDCLALAIRKEHRLMVINKVKDGDIVLMHDIYSATANALEIIIPSLKSKGYTFVTVSDLFYYKNIPLEKGKVYGFAR